MSDAPEATPALRPLTERQRRFVEAYCATGSLLKAALAAGYSPKHARVYGQDLLKLPHVRAAVEARWADLAQEAGYNQRRLQIELAALAFSDISHYQVDTETGEVTLTKDAPAHAMRAVQKIKRRITSRTKDGETETTVDVEIALWDKNTAIANAGKNLGMFVERVLTAETTLDELLREAAGADGDA